MCAATPIDTDNALSDLGPVVGVWQFGFEQCPPTRFASWSFTDREKSSLGMCDG
jgi:hypothetical protein